MPDLSKSAQFDVTRQLWYNVQAGHLPGLTEGEKLISEEIIAQINDRFREEITAGPSDLGGLFWCGDAVNIIPVNKLKIIKAIREWVDGDDPHGEREGGTVVVQGRPFNWKIFYYDRESLNDSDVPDMGSEDPSNLKITVRHLNVTVSQRS